MRSIREYLKNRSLNEQGIAAAVKSKRFLNGVAVMMIRASDRGTITPSGRRDIMPYG